MLRTLRALTACALALLLLATAASADDDGWWGGLAKGENVSLADVLADAGAWRGKTFTCTCIFHKMDKYYDPLRSGLNAQRYDNFALWPDGLSLWEIEDFKKTYPFFYLPKTHQQRNELMKLARFTRIQATMKIRGKIRGKPAFEVLSFRETGHRLGERAVKRVIEGDKYARMGHTNIAASRYRDVLATHPDLPPVYNLKIRKRLADALREMGYADKAERVEGGAPIIGSSPLPKPNPMQRAKQPLAGFDGPPAGAGDATGSPDASARGDATGSPDSMSPAAGDASGSPDGGLGTPPTFDRGNRRGRRGRGAMPRNPNPRNARTPDGTRLPGTGAMPGQPVGDLPGSPAGSGRPLPRDPNTIIRAPRPGTGAPVELPGAVPPKRAPRLSGVK